jgi:hypothetical protein
MMSSTHGIFLRFLPSVRTDTTRCRFCDFVFLTLKQHRGCEYWMSEFPHPAKIGLASRRLAPPPSIANVIRASEQTSHSAEAVAQGLVAGHSGVVDLRGGNASAEGPAQHHRLYPVGAHCPLSRSAATCVSKRQRLQAECHERTKEQMSAFFSQRSLEAECLPVDQARHVFRIKQCSL